jgi:hypothetical protein
MISTRHKTLVLQTKVRLRRNALFPLGKFTVIQVDRVLPIDIFDGLTGGKSN